jgi:hypothetical protein
MSILRGMEGGQNNAIYNPANKKHERLTGHMGDSTLNICKKSAGFLKMPVSCKGKGNMSRRSKPTINYLVTRMRYM